MPNYNSLLFNKASAQVMEEKGETSVQKAACPTQQINMTLSRAKDPIASLFSIEIINLKLTMACSILLSIAPLLLPAALKGRKGEEMEHISFQWITE